MGHTSRLYKILVRERDREEIEILGRGENAFKIIKRTLSKKFSFNKYKTDLEKQAENNCCGIFFQKVTNSFLHTFNPPKVRANSTNSDGDEFEDNLPPTTDSAYFSDSFNHCESESLEVTETANNPSEFSSALSRSSSLTCGAIKKSVRIILPQTATREKPFGVHLQIKNAVTFQVPETTSCDKGNVSDQVRNIKHRAKCNLVEQFPSITTTINHLFTDNPRHLLMSLNTTMIGDLLFNLRTLLFSPLLPMVHSLDIVIFVMIKFLHCLSVFLQPVEYFHPRLVELGAKWEMNFYKHKETCLVEVRAIYIDIWCRLLVAD